MALNAIMGRLLPNSEIAIPSLGSFIPTGYRFLLQIPSWPNLSCPSTTPFLSQICSYLQSEDPINFYSTDPTTVSPLHASIPPTTGATSLRALYATLRLSSHRLGACLVVECAEVTVGSVLFHSEVEIVAGLEPIIWSMLLELAQW